MSAGAERALFGLLLEVGSIETLILEGFTSEFVPSAELRPIYDWAIHQYQLTGGESAPTSIMFHSTDVEGQPGRSMGELLEEYDISLDDTPEESVEWVIEELKARHLTRKAGQWTKALSEDITSAPSHDRPGIFQEHVAGLVAVSLSLQPKRSSMDLVEDAEEILNAYEIRKREGTTFKGMRFGLPEVDAHTGGIHDGELCIVGAPPKGSKSYFIARTALEEFRAGRSVVLNTLENSIAMTRDRIACLATGIDPQRFEAGLSTPEEERAVTEWVREVLLVAENKLWILSPDEGQRRVEHMVMAAQIRNADSLLIDQLTFVEPSDPKMPRYLQIRDITHTLKTMISTGHHQMPCLMTHQMSRDGIKSARKVGYFHMDDMAEGSEVERTADWALAMWQSDDGREVSQFLLQMLAARRRDLKNWNVFWDISTGTMETLSEETLQ